MKLYLLWDEDDYVEMTGTTAPPRLQGVFSSVDSIYSYMQSNWADFTQDPRDVRFRGPKYREQVQPPAGVNKDFYTQGPMYIWYEERYLDEQGAVT